MPSSPVTKVVEHLRKTVLWQEEGHLSDGQLLDRFLETRDHAAFAALVHRHGPMVWGVCLRIVGHADDAEDAFQAAFLILVRKAAAVKPREAVGNWLYGVASHAALKARAASARVRAKEKQVTSMPDPAKDQRDDREELQRLLDQELGVLPDKYRLPVVLCDLEGRTRKEVAAQLKIPEGTLSSRLTTAHQMLAKRMARHGLAVSGASLAALFAQNAASASVPPAVVSAAINAATLVAASKGVVAGVVSTKVAALTEGVLKTMLLTKLKMAALVVLMLGLTAFTCGMLAYGMTNADRDDMEQLAAKASEKPKAVGGDKENTLTVTIKPRKNRIRADEPFDVDVRVVNSSKLAQSFRVMSGSWNGQWKSSSERVYWDPTTITKDVEQKVILEPGKGYEKTGAMRLRAGKEKVRDPQEVARVVQANLESVEDVKLDLKLRAEAARQLGAVGDKASAVKLVKALPQAEGILFFEIAVALGRIGNVEVLPQLLAIQQNPGDRSGKSLAALQHTVEALQKPQEKVTFKLGFTPLGSEQTFWSNEVTIQVAPDDAPPVKPKDDKDLLQGTWHVLEVEVGEPREGKEGSKDQILVINGDLLTIKYDDGSTKEMIYQIDPKQKPKAIDLRPVAENEKGYRFKGIYELDGDRLKLLYMGGERPTSFDPKDYDQGARRGIRRFVLKRAPAKPKLEAQPKAKAAQPAWGDAVDGVRYGISLSNAKARFALGEEIQFAFHAQNKNPKAVKLAPFAMYSGGGDAKWPLTDDFVPIFTSANGKTIVGSWNTNKKESPGELALKAGETRELGRIGWHLDPLSLRSVDLKPGRYTVHFERLLVGKPSPTGKIDIEVVEPVKDKLPANKTAWGQAVEGIEYGLELKDKRKTYCVGETVSFILKARNVAGKRASFEYGVNLETPSIIFGVPHPTVIDAAGKEVWVDSGIRQWGADERTRTVTLSAGQVVVVSEYRFVIGRAESAYIDAGPGTYRVRYDSFYPWGKKKQPTGTLEIVVTEAADAPPAKPKKPAGLTARIVAPTEIASTAPVLKGELVLTNEGKSAVRVCTLCSEGPLFDFIFCPHQWKSDSPSLDMSAQRVVTLAPGKTVALPFQISRVHYKDRKSLTIKASYFVDKDHNLCKKLNLWSGSAEAKPALVKVSTPPEGLTVTAKSQKNLVRANQDFKVDLRVVNSSKSPQFVRVMRGSSWQHWQSSNKPVSVVGLPGSEAFEETVKLEPDDAYEKTLWVRLGDAKPQEKVSFKLGFTPIGSKQTFWSNEVTVEVDPDKKPAPLPRGNAALPELAKKCNGAVVATLQEIGDPELGPPGAADYASKWKVEKVLRGTYPETAHLTFRVQSVPIESRERPPAVGKTYILITYEVNANQVAAILDADEKNLRKVQELLRMPPKADDKRKP